ncbi:hypothetical protein GCM10009797_02360 [Nocardioides hwasunensis]
MCCPRETVRGARGVWEADEDELSTGLVDKLGTLVDDTLADLYTAWSNLWTGFGRAAAKAV